MLTSNEHSVVFRTMTNGDLCDFLRSVVAFSFTSHRKKAANINDTECNIYIYIYTCFRKMKLYDGCKMKAI